MLRAIWRSCGGSSENSFHTSRSSRLPAAKRQTTGHRHDANDISLYESLVVYSRFDYGHRGTGAHISLGASKSLRIPIFADLFTCRRYFQYASGNPMLGFYPCIGGATTYNTTLLSNWNLVLPVRSESKWAHGMSARRGRPSIGRQEKRGGPDFRRSLVQSDAFLHPVADARALCVRDVRQTISSAVGEY